MGARLKFRCEGGGGTWKKVAKRPHIMGAHRGGGCERVGCRPPGEII